MRFQIGEAIYNGTDLDLLSLRDILLFEKEAAELGRPLKWGEVQGWAQEIDELARAAADKKSSAAKRQASEDAIRDHEGTLMVMALTIWAARKLAGDGLSFSDAIDFPMRDLRWLPSPEDRKVAANPTKARKSTKASGRAARPRPGARPARPTSKVPSTSG